MLFFNMNIQLQKYIQHYLLQENNPALLSDLDGDNIQSNEVTPKNININHTPTKYLMVNKQQYVDLGLPSGNLWAVKDIGAIDINRAGDQYQWGNNINLNVANESELEQYKSQIIHYKAPKSFEYDIVNDKMGGGWQVPTAADFQELIDNCKVSYYDDFNYITFTGKTGQILRFNAYECSEVMPDLDHIEISLGCVDGVPMYSSGGGYWTQDYNNTPVVFTFIVDDHEVDIMTDQFEAELYGFSYRGVLHGELLND